jgi:hypothetical protein
MAIITGPGQQGQATQGMQPPSTSQNKIPSGFKLGKIQQFTPEQMQLLEQLMGHVGPDSFLSKIAGGDEQAFQKAEAPAMRQFNDILGGIGSRFSGMGMGARKSSGFQNTTTAAGSNFAEQLQANRMNMQQQATGDLMNYASMLLGQRPFEQQLIQKDNQGGGGGWGGAAKGAATGATAGAMFGPWGAAAGGILGGAAGYFSK